jgi:outer membrane protein
MLFEATPMTFRSCLLSLFVALLVSCATARSEDYQPLPSPITLEGAVNYALAHQPILRAQNAQEEAAEANLSIAREQLIPRGDIDLQENRATGNVVPGAHFSMAGIPPISGPPTGRVFDSGVWGSTAGLSAWWDIAHLTQQMTLVDAALADRSGSRAAYNAGKLSVAFAGADAFALAVEAQQEVGAAGASVERAKVLLTNVKALVRSGLRPGADEARAQAEVALAETQMARAQQAESVSLSQLARALGAAGQAVTIEVGKLREAPPAEQVAEVVSARNPVLVGAASETRAARAREHAALLEYIPRVEIAGALFGRGNGLFPGGANLAFAQGLLPDTPNWAAGIVVTIPIFQYPEIHSRVDLAAAQAKLSAARGDEVAQDVQSQIDSARAILNGAYKVARNTRVSVDSSSAALNQASARYKAGLYTIDAVAEALRLVAQAQADDAIAKVEIWRAKMLLARAVGDIGPLMSEISEASGGH